MACARNSFNNQPSIFSIPASKKSEEISSLLPSKMTIVRDEVPPHQSIPTINDHRGCSEEEDLFSKMLPIEMQLQVLSRVPVGDLVRHVCLVNRQWRTLTATDAFWRDVAAQIFGGQDPWSSLLAEHGTICSSHQLNMFAPADVDMKKNGVDTAPTKMEGIEGAIDEEEDDRMELHLVPNGKMKEVVLYRLRELRVFWPFKSARNLYYCAERGFVHMVESILRDPSKVFQFKKEHIGMAIELATAKGLREVVDVLQPVMRSHTVAEAR
jgi:hypothetical protein